MAKAAGGTCVVVCDHKVKPLKLKILKAEISERVLPKDLMEQFWRAEVRSDIGNPEPST